MLHKLIISSVTYFISVLSINDRCFSSKSGTNIEKVVGTLLRNSLNAIIGLASLITFAS